MTTYGLTATGWRSKTVEEILADLQTRQASTVDGSLNSSATGVLANVNASIALELAQLWELGGELWDAHDPNSAQGIAADHNGALAGITRLVHTKSKVTLRLTLDANSPVAAGSVVSQLGNARVRFVTLEDAERLTDGTLDVPAEAEEFGAVNAGPGTLTVIESPASGWNAVTNLDPAIAGTDVETDEAYLIRRVKDIATQGGSTFDGAVADVRKALGVVEADGIENDTDAVVDGLPPHSFEVIVRGGDDDAIAAAIWKNKPAGIQTVGTEGVTVLDTEGVEHEVRFTRATLVLLHVNYQVLADDTYVTGGVETAISAATANPAHAAHFGIGRNVYVARLQAAGLNAQGVINLTLDVAIDPAVPADPNPAASNTFIVIGPREIAQFLVPAWTVTP